MNTSSQKKLVPVPNMSFEKAAKEIGRNPYVDWVMVVLVTLCVGIVLVLGGAYLFRTVSLARTDAANSSPDTAILFDPKALSAVLATFDAKQNLTLEAKKGYTGIADPSE